MKDIVVIPSYWRSEFLYLCLEHLVDCPESKDKEFRVYQDFKVGDEVRFAEDAAELDWVIKYWSERLNIKAFVRPPNTFYSGAYNVLRALKSAYESGAEYIHVVEDDVFVMPDYFKWHNQWHELVKDKFNIHATAACRPNDVGVIVQSKGLDCLDYLTGTLVRTLGICWNRQALEGIIKHAVPEYYTSAQNMAEYIRKNFPNSQYDPTQSIEYDGLMTRVAEAQKEIVIYPVAPRAYHVGIYGFHRGIDSKHMPVGTLPDRIKFFRKRLSDPVWLHRVADFQTDVQAYPVINGPKHI